MMQEHPDGNLKYKMQFSLDFVNKDGYIYQFIEFLALFMQNIKLAT